MIDLDQAFPPIKEVPKALVAPVEQKRNLQESVLMVENLWEKVHLAIVHKVLDHKVLNLTEIDLVVKKELLVIGHKVRNHSATDPVAKKDHLQKIHQATSRLPLVKINIQIKMRQLSALTISLSNLE